MKVSGVRTPNGDVVTLVFADAGVLVLDRSAPHSRLLRCAGAALFVASAVGAAGIGVGHTVNLRAGLWLSAAAALLVAVSAVMAVTAWLAGGWVRRRFEAGASTATIGVEQVDWARSAGAQGRLTVTLALMDQSVREFTATGVTCEALAHQFAAMLGVAADRSPTVDARRGGDSG